MGQALSHPAGQTFAMPHELITYRPSAFYFRTAIRSAKSQAELAELALHLVAEHETLREWVREHGMVPPKWFITPSERAARAPGSVSYLSTKATESATEG